MCVLRRFISYQNLLRSVVDIADSRPYQPLLPFRGRILQDHRHVISQYLVRPPPNINPSVETGRTTFQSHGTNRAWSADFAGAKYCDHGVSPCRRGRGMHSLLPRWVNYQNLLFWGQRSECAVFPFRSRSSFVYQHRNRCTFFQSPV